MHWWFMIMTDFVASSIQSFRFFFCQIVIYSPPCNFHVIMHALKKIVIIGFEFSRAKKKEVCQIFFYYHMKISPPFSTFLSIFKWQNVWTHAKLKSRYYYKLFRFVKSCSSRFFSHFTLQQKAWFFNLWGHAPMNYRSAELLLRTVVH